MSNFWQRTLTGLFFVTFLIIGILWNPISFFGLFLVIEILALREFFIIAEKLKAFPQKHIGNIVGAVIFILPFGVYFFNVEYSLNLLLIPIISSLFIFELFRDKKNPIINITITLFGIVYVSLPVMLLNHIVGNTISYMGKRYRSLSFWCNIW